MANKPAPPVVTETFKPDPIDFDAWVKLGAILLLIAAVSAVVLYLHCQNKQTETVCDAYGQAVVTKAAQCGWSLPRGADWYAEQCRAAASRDDVSSICGDTIAAMGCNRPEQFKARANSFGTCGARTD